MSITDFAQRLHKIEKAEYTIYEGGEDTKKDPKAKKSEMEQEFEKLENSVNRANAGQGKQKDVQINSNDILSLKSPSMIQSKRNTKENTSPR